LQSGHIGQCPQVRHDFFSGTVSTINCQRLVKVFDRAGENSLLLIGGTRGRISPADCRNRYGVETRPPDHFQQIRNKHHESEYFIRISFQLFDSCNVRMPLL
jgi:hypothetical protein